MTKNIISIYSHHNATISIRYEGRYYNFEMERYFKERYLSLHKVKPRENMIPMVGEAMDAIGDLWGIENDFDVCICDHNLKIAKKFEDIKEVIRAKEYRMEDHHRSHAANVFFLSPYDKALIVSYDGVGNDGTFNIYVGNGKEIRLVNKKVCPSMGILYNDLGFSIKEINKHFSDNIGQTTTRLSLALAGKIMGLSAYGNVREDWEEAFRNYYNGVPLEKLSMKTGLDFTGKQEFLQRTKGDMIIGQDSYDVAATSQKVFEDLFFERIREELEIYKDLPICLGGGCSLNVLVNEKLRNKVGNKVFVAPNTDDSGISLGGIFLEDPPESKVGPITYTGVPILDKDKIGTYISEYNAKKTDLKELVRLLREGKTIGIVQGNSEVGPRALGNRSIICDPKFKDMKDKINKIKHREWYRPFAPVVRLEDANKYFHFDHESPYMSFAPKVREEYISQLSAITHEDKTARLQTVKKEDHEFFYNLLSEFGGVLLNTSFNIRGNPILTTIEDALYVLTNTSLDYVYIEGYLFKGGINE